MVLEVDGAQVLGDSGRFPPDIFQYIQLRPYLCAWVAHHPEQNRDVLFKWMAPHLGVTRQQVWNLITGTHKVQPEQVAGAARMMALDGERREYLRRLVALQNATYENAKERRLSVWEMHAAKTGLPATLTSEMMTRLDRPGSEEAAVQALLPQLRAYAPEAESPQEIAALLIGGPDPQAVSRALAPTEASTHQAHGSRMTELGPPDLLSVEALAWHGLLEMSREALLRVPAEERDFQLSIGSLDAAGVRAADAAHFKLGRRLRQIVGQTAEEPVTRLTLLLTEQIPLTEVLALPPARICPPDQGTPPRLPLRKSPVAKDEEGVTFATPTDGRPCLLRYLDLPTYASAWMLWRQERRQPANVRWLAVHIGVSRAVAHELITGATLFAPHHVAGVVKALSLPEVEATYAQGVARYAVATDAEDRSRERRALIAYAAEHGVHTLAGDLYQVTSHWGPQAILGLTRLPGCRDNAAWLSLMLRGRVSALEAGTWTDALVRTGWLERDEHGALQLGLPNPQATLGVDRLAGYALHESLLRQMQAELSFPVAGQRWRGWGLALPSAAVPLVRRALQTWQDEILQVFRGADHRRDASPHDRVVAVAAQLFPCTFDLINRSG